MIRRISPREAESLITQECLDVVDVRSPDDFARGHVPTARSVPLAELAADPRAALPRDGVVFVCAKGVRSLAAAQAAEAAGLDRLFSVDGGTSGWAGEGLPIVADA
jgi:rhodanese-related sulfurtransferase